EFGYGWKTAYVPYLVLSQEGQTNLIYAAEMDGSVIAYRRQAGVTPATWKPETPDNPLLVNQVGDSAGSLANPFNAKIESSAAGDVYTLTGSDGSRRVFRVRSYPISTLTRQRPYLETWTD